MLAPHGESETRAVKLARADLSDSPCARNGELVRDIFDQRNSVISPAAVINARVPRSTHIFSTTLEIVALMRNHVGLSGACFQKSRFSYIYKVCQNALAMYRKQQIAQMEM